jgi:hypothetical protein
MSPQTQNITLTKSCADDRVASQTVTVAEQSLDSQRQPHHALLLSSQKGRPHAMSVDPTLWATEQAPAQRLAQVDATALARDSDSLTGTLLSALTHTFPLRKHTHAPSHLHTHATLIVTPTLMHAGTNIASQAGSHPHNTAQHSIKQHRSAAIHQPENKAAHTPLSPHCCSHSCFSG